MNSAGSWEFKGKIRLNGNHNLIWRCLNNYVLHCPGIGFYFPVLFGKPLIFTELLKFIFAPFFYFNRGRLDMMI
jgi:hypothetical protein